MKKAVIFLTTFVILTVGCTCTSRRHTSRFSHESSSHKIIKGSSWTESELQSATTTKDAHYLSEDEKEVIKLCNLARLYPKKFLHVYLSASKYTKSRDPYVISLLRDLDNSVPTNALHPNTELTKAAEIHALDMGQHGSVGHNSSNGISCEKRISSLYQGFSGECCQYGSKNPLQIVLDLLVDQDVPSLGHRKMILHGSANEIGVAIRPHKVYSSNCVLDFGLNYSSSAIDVF